MNSLTPIDFKEFIDFFSIDVRANAANYYDVYAEAIERIKDYAPGPFFCFVCNNIKLKIEWVSENVSTLTPFSREEWMCSTPEFFAELYHPDDRFYILAALQLGGDMYINMDEESRKNIRFNIYGRMVDCTGAYRWTLLQAPEPKLNEHGQIESSLVIIYDLSSFQIGNTPVLSIIDYSNKHIQYYKHVEKTISRINLEIPPITNREKEILLLMMKGYNTPQIAREAFISYHTVENHKRNLRKKTNTKTSAELIGFVISHNLLI